MGPYFFGKKGAYIGGWLGFMLLMGGWIVYWVGEYVYLQYNVAKLCKKEAGLFVYITPEEWRKQIGKEEWNTLYSDFKMLDLDNNLELKFDDKIYHGSYQFNRRIVAYEAKGERRDIIVDSDRIYVDKETNQILFRTRYFSVGASYDSLKIWLNNLKDCDIDKWSYHDRLFNDKYSNYNALQGN